MRLYDYDGFGRTIETRTNSGTGGPIFKEEFTYDELSRVFQHIEPHKVDNQDNRHNNNATAIQNVYDSQGFLKRIVNAYNSEGASNTYWEARKADARGNVIEERAGNGLITQRFFSGKTGHLKGIKTYSLLAPSQPVQDLQYVYDKLGNLKERKDFSYNGSTKKNVLESFDYDNMNRLETSTIGNDVQTVTYMKNGNIKTKTGLGTYIYGAATVSDTGVVRSNAQQNAGPHAVSEAKGVKYTYDNNGNMTTDTSGRSIKYTAFDKAYEMKKGSDTVLFSYDTGRSRYKRVDKKTTNSNTTTTTTYYVGNVEYVEKSNGSVDVKRNVGGRLIEVNSFYANGNKVANSQTLAYLFKDRLGSLHKQIDANGELIEELDFNAWGQRRHAQDPKQLLAKYQQGYTAETKITVRGFTGHEMVDSMGLIHMNGRIYDAALGRFLQADPIVQAPNSAQSHNRYSYGFNNPMGGTDPSGYSFFTSLNEILGKIDTRYLAHKHVFSQVPALRGIVQTGLTFIPGFGPLASAHFAADSVLFSGGSLGEGLRRGALSYLSAQAFTQIGGIFNGPAGAWNAADGVLHVLAHATTGGVLAELQGGKFGHGFISAGLTKGLTPHFTGIGGDAFNVNGINVLEVAIAATLGGTISEATGGKFANGAITAAFGNVFNQQKSKPKPVAQKRRDAIVARAEEALANGEPYAFEDRNGNFPAGSYKCNQFVCNVANDAGASIPLNVDQAGNAWPPTAGTFGNSNASIPGWKIVSSPQPGDIIAQQRAYSDASGHVGIVVGSGDVISARTGGLSRDPISSVFPADHPQASGPIVYRRYVGQ